MHGLLRGKEWRRPAAITVSAANVVAGVIALVADSNGAAIGLAVGAIALVLCSVPTERMLAGRTQPNVQ